MRKDFLSFLFGTDVVINSSPSLGESVIRMFEEAADSETEQMVANKKPLADALRAVGITAKVEECPQACALHCETAEDYRNYVALLSDPENIHKLAELGWVAEKCGDQAMSAEAPDFKISFIELGAQDTPENSQSKEKVGSIVKKAREFATEPMDRDDKLNPVETEHKPSSDKQKGVGEPKDGAQPKGSLKDSLTAKELARQMLEGHSISEMTGCAAIPAIEKPIGVAANRLRKKKKADDPSSSNR